LGRDHFSGFWGICECKRPLIVLVLKLPFFNWNSFLDYSVLCLSGLGEDLHIKTLIIHGRHYPQKLKGPHKAGQGPSHPPAHLFSADQTLQMLHSLRRRWYYYRLCTLISPSPLMKINIMQVWFFN
jgi:hypothetical protein